MKKRKVVLLIVVVVLILTACSNQKQKEQKKIKKEIPELTEGKMSKDALKYHFKDIYDTHSNIVNWLDQYYKDKKKHPFIKESNYTKETERLVVKGVVVLRDKKYSGVITDVNYEYEEEYNTSNKELISLKFKLINPSWYDGESHYEHISHQVFRNLASVAAFEFQGIEAGDFVNTLESDKIPEGECWYVGKWCVSNKHYNSFNNDYVILRTTYLEK